MITDGLKEYTMNDGLLVPKNIFPLIPLRSNSAKLSSETPVYLQAYPWKGCFNQSLGGGGTGVKKP